MAITYTRPVPPRGPSRAGRDDIGGLAALVVQAHPGDKGPKAVNVQLA